MTEHTELATAVEEAVAALGLPPDWDLRVEIRPRRRAVALELKPGEPVKMLVPPHMSPERVADFIRDRSGRLARAIHEARQLAPDFAVKKLIDGEHFALLGRSYPLRLTDDGPPTRIEHRADTLGRDEVLCVRRDQVKVMRDAVIALYREHGEAWAKQHGQPYEHHSTIPGRTPHQPALASVRAAAGADQVRPRARTRARDPTTRTTPRASLAAPDEPVDA